MNEYVMAQLRVGEPGWEQERERVEERLRKACQRLGDGVMRYDAELEDGKVYNYSTGLKDLYDAYLAVVAEEGGEVSGG